MDIGEGHYPPILKCEIWDYRHFVQGVGTIESTTFERRKGDGLSIGDAVALGSNAHWDQCFKHEHV
jgi:hypothetical protein